MNTILFDLDGTLLPMDQEKFIGMYFKALAEYMVPHGFEPKKLTESIWICTKKAMSGDGSLSNHDTFWKSYQEIYGREALQFRAVFDKFYETEFSSAKSGTWINPLASKMIQLLKSKGYRLVIATNPIFPKVATYARIEWAGLDAGDFEWITTYENSNYCKPNIKYYENILAKINADPKDCLMVGNDVAEDMCAGDIGMDTILLTDHLINRDDRDISQFTRLDYEGLYQYFCNLPDIQ